MPRGYNVSRLLPALKTRRGPQPKSITGPDLYNGHDRIARSQGLLLIPKQRAQLKKRITHLQRLQTPSVYTKSHQNSGVFAKRALEIRALESQLKALPSGPEYSRILSEVKTFRESWRGHVSEDVEAFYDACKTLNYPLLPSEKKLLLTNPAIFFSSPQNVPPQLRQQQYFPQFKITFVRSGWMGPYFARFRVPLWFSKLDLRSYLKSVYDVDTVHVRSLIRRGVRIRDQKNPRSLGRRIQMPGRKEMFAQLVEPFEWPVAADDVDLEPFETKEFNQQVRDQTLAGLSLGMNDYYGTHVNKRHRKSMAEQAKELLEGKRLWRATWKEIPESARAMTGELSSSESDKAGIANNDFTTSR